MSEDRFAGKSRAYIESALRTEAELRLESRNTRADALPPRDLTNKSPEYVAAYRAIEAQEEMLKREAAAAYEARMNAALAMRNDETQRRMLTDQFRQDGAEAVSGPLRPNPNSALGARMRMLTSNGMRQDAAEHKMGLIDQKARAERDAAILAQCEAQQWQQRLKLERDMIAVGVRMDAADNRNNARASRERMMAQQDMYARTPQQHEQPVPQREYRGDAAPGTNRSSAAAARERLYKRGA